MQTVKSHIRNDDTTIIICPACNRAKRISVATFKRKKHILKVRCSCKTVFKVQLDYRNHYRKSVSLSGIYETLYQYDQSKGAMDIIDLSPGGLRYNVIGVNRLQTGFVLALDFQLDDKQRSLIKKQAMVRSVNSNVIGCEFFDQENINKALAFYLRR